MEGNMANTQTSEYIQVNASSGETSQVILATNPNNEFTGAFKFQLDGEPADIRDMFIQGALLNGTEVEVVKRDGKRLLDIHHEGGGGGDTPVQGITGIKVNGEPVEVTNNIANITIPEPEQVEQGIVGIKVNGEIVEVDSNHIANISISIPEPVDQQGTVRSITLRGNQDSQSAAQPVYPDENGNVALVIDGIESAGADVDQLYLNGVDIHALLPLLPQEQARQKALDAIDGINNATTLQQVKGVLIQFLQGTFVDNPDDDSTQAEQP